MLRDVFLLRVEFKLKMVLDGNKTKYGFCCMDDQDQNFDWGYEESFMGVSNLQFLQMALNTTWGISEWYEAFWEPIVQNQSHIFIDGVIYDWHEIQPIFALFDEAIVFRIIL